MLEMLDQQLMDKFPYQSLPSEQQQRNLGKRKGKVCTMCGKVAWAFIPSRSH